MGRRRTVQIRSAQELKSQTGRVHAQRGKAMKSLKKLQELNEGRAKPKPKRAQSKTPPPPGGIHMGE